jgi:predicted N-acetyltransferase YhbS
MNNEFIFGKLADVERVAKTKRWRRVGRSSWEKRDGTCVHFIAFDEQLAAVQEGERVYVAGRLAVQTARTLKRIGANVVRA